MRVLFEGSSLHTVCESALCPNLGECFCRGTATFLLLGDVCTRDCRFCAIKTGTPSKPDAAEPARIAATAEKLGIKHVVLTSVARDDLPDGGAAHFSRTMAEIRQAIPGVSVECLVPDFRGSEDALRTLIAGRLDVLNHNVETVPRLYPGVRPMASYGRSLDLLRRAGRAKGVITKSGIMMGLGEERREVVAVMRDLRSAGCRFLTIGQYLAPSPGHYPVRRYLEPEEFDEYRVVGEEMGFAAVVAGPFVRSSYMAAEMLASCG